MVYNTQKGFAVGLVVLIVAAVALAGGATYVATSEEVNLRGEGGILERNEDREDDENATTSTSTGLDLNLDGNVDLDLGDDDDNATNTNGSVDGNVDVKSDIYLNTGVKAEGNFWSKIGF